MALVMRGSCGMCRRRGDPSTGAETVDRAEKKEAVAALHDTFSKASVVVVAQYSGLTVAQMQRLRKQMKQAGARVQVAKNRLAKIALNGTDVAAIGPLLKGPTLIRSFERSGRGGQGGRRLRQGSREVRDSGRRDGQDGARRRGGEVARDLALARRIARQAVGAPRQPRRPRSPSLPLLPPPRWRAWCRPTPTRTQPDPRLLSQPNRRSNP